MMTTAKRLHPLANDKILAFPKLKDFADDNINVTQNIKLFFHRVENIEGKRRKCWLPAVSPVPNMFSEGLYHRGVKMRHSVVKPIPTRQQFGPN